MSKRVLSVRYKSYSLQFRNQKNTTVFTEVSRDRFIFNLISTKLNQLVLSKLSSLSLQTTSTDFFEKDLIKIF